MSESITGATLLLRGGGSPEPPSLFATLAPFIAGLVLLLLSPLLTRKVEKTVVADIDHDTAVYLDAYPAEWQEAIEERIPPHLREPDLADHFTYVADAVQIFPYSLLPVVGGIFAVLTDIRTEVAVSVLVGSALVAIALDAWVVGRSSSGYAVRSWFGYTPVVLIGLAANILAIVVIAIWGNP